MNIPSQRAGFFNDLIPGAYILAGGQSRRMGRDKLFIEMNEQSLLSRTMSSCRDVFSEVALVAKSKEPFAQFDCRVLIDKPGIDGPLAGVIAALEDCSSDRLFITAADLYDLNPVTIETLLKSYRGEQYLGLRETDHIQPLCGIYAKTALGPLLKAAENGTTRMSEAISELDSRFIAPLSENWRNINSPEDLKALGVSGD